MSVTDISALAGSQRIVVVGSSGSGKTTLADQLAVRLGVPHIELDALNWEANWIAAPTEVFRERVQAATNAPAWVLDGNYSKARDIVWSRADTLIWLDYSLGLILTRLTRRTARRIFTKQELWSGNRESWTMPFQLSADKNIFLWTIASYRRRHRDYPAQLALPEYAHLKVLRLKTPRETARLFA